MKSINSNGIAALLMACAIACFAGAANAVTVELTWQMPTTRENGAALPAGEIAKTTIYAGSSALIDVPAPATKASVDLPACSATQLTATVTDTAGLESVASQALSVSICRPSAPRITGVRVPPVR